MDISLNASPVRHASGIMARLGAAWPVRVLIMWLALVVLLLAIDAPAIAIGRFGDPDDALRLIEVRDLLAGQSWFDLHQYRIAAPQGVPMHWSRLVDIPLAGMIVLLRPVLGTAMAEMVTVVAVPLLTLLAALMLVGRMTAKFFDTETVGIVCLVTAIGGPLLFQMTPLRIDHHGWQVVLALAALNGLAAHNRVAARNRLAARGGAIVIGLALAALLAISIEGLPITAVFLGVLAWRGLRGGRGFADLAAASATLALGSAAIFLGTRGIADLVNHCDQVSPVHIATFALVATGCTALAALAPRRWPIAAGVLGLTGLGAIALYLGVAPQCRGGTFVALDPLVYNFWYKGVAEGMPFWHLPLALAIETVCVPLTGLVATIMLWRGAHGAADRAWWCEYALVMVGALVIGALVARASSTACAFAAMPTGALVLRAIIGLRSVAPMRRVGGYVAILIVLMPPLPVLAWNRIAMARNAGNVAGAAPAMSQCRYREAARALDALPPTDLFLPLDIGPDVLVRSHQRVIATGHHRGAQGMHDVIAAFLGTPDEAHAIILRRHATMIVVCPDIPEPANFRYYAPDGFMAQLLRGQAPGWLEPVNLAPGSHMLFWRVIR